MTSSSVGTPLVMAINENYALPAVCALYSIGQASPGVFGHAIILASDLTPGSREGLKRVAAEVGIEAEIYDSTDALEALGDVPVKTQWSDRMTKDTWARLVIPETFKEMTRCLYVDADTLCLGSMEELLEADLGDKIIGAVSDILPPASGMANYLSAEKSADTEGGIPYFNAGVLLIDCEKWRQADITSRAVDFARRNPDLIRFWDQDALNAVLRDDWKALDRQWNTYPLSDLFRTGTGAMKKVLPEWSRADIELHKKLEHRAKIIHFITVTKPWLPNYPDNSVNYDRYQQVMQSVVEILNRK